VGGGGGGGWGVVWGGGFLGLVFWLGVGGVWGFARGFASGGNTAQKSQNESSRKVERNEGEMDRALDPAAQGKLAPRRPEGEATHARNTKGEPRQ